MKCCASDCKSQAKMFEDGGYGWCYSHSIDHARYEFTNERANV